MGVYIPNWKMPNSCGECLFICKESTCRYGKGYERADFCPLVEVKPHGRLIDADALMGVIQDYIEEYSDLDEDGMHNLKWCAMKETEMAINDAPTIVEADNNTQNMSAESEGEE